MRDITVSLTQQEFAQIERAITISGTGKNLPEWIKAIVIEHSFYVCVNADEVSTTIIADKPTYGIGGTSE